MRFHCNSSMSVVHLLIKRSYLGSRLFCNCYLERGNPNSGIKENARLSGINLAPGDIIKVRFFYTPELNDNQIMYPDGEILIKLVVGIKAEGKGPAELRDESLILYENKLNEPEVNVVVRSLQRQHVYIGVRVTVSRIIEMTAGTNFFEAIMQAVRFNLWQAGVRNVFAIHREDGKYFAYSVNLKTSLEGNGIKEFISEAEDIFHVPQTEIAGIGRCVDRCINRSVPLRGFFIGMN